MDFRSSESRTHPSAYLSRIAILTTHSRIDLCAHPSPAAESLHDRLLAARATCSSPGEANLRSSALMIYSSACRSVYGSPSKTYCPISGTVRKTICDNPYYHQLLQRNRVYSGLTILTDPFCHISTCISFAKAPLNATLASGAYFSPRHHRIS